VAFFAGKEVLQKGLGLEQNIMFDTIMLNLDNGFHPVNSNFVAPRAGVYLFSATLMADMSPVEIQAAITVNGVHVARIFGHAISGRHGQTSHTVILHLQANDEVCVRNIFFENRHIFGYLYSSFSGVLLFDM